MTRSMTAFARSERQGTWGRISLELRSVNHRYLEITTRLPEDLRDLEMAIKNTVGKVLSRGKIDCTLRYQACENNSEELIIDRDLVIRLAHASREIDAIIYNPSPVNSLDILRWPGVLKVPEQDPGTLRAEALSLLNDTLAELDADRRREGEKLCEFILQRCAAIPPIIATVRSQLPDILAGMRHKLLERLTELRDELDAHRLEQEMLLLAQKIDVDEELDRLGTHVDEVCAVAKRDEPIGRRLDFLMQELNREANTLGAKSISTDTTRAAINLKVLIEQMREQVQNIE